MSRLANKASLRQCPKPRGDLRDLLIGENAPMPRTFLYYKREFVGNLNALPPPLHKLAPDEHLVRRARVPVQITKRHATVFETVK